MIIESLIRERIKEQLDMLEAASKKTAKVKPGQIMIKKKDTGAEFPVNKETAVKDGGKKYTKPSSAKVAKSDGKKTKKKTAVPQKKRRGKDIETPTPVKHKGLRPQPNQKGRVPASPVVDNEETVSGNKTAALDLDVVKSARISIEQASRAAGKEISGNAKKRMSHIESTLDVAKSIGAKSTNISKNSTIINALGNDTIVEFEVAVPRIEGLSPEASRKASGKEFEAAIKEKYGKNVVVSSEAILARGGKTVDIEIDGLKYRLQFKEHVEGSGGDSDKSGGRYSQAHEGIVSIATGLLMSGKSTDEVVGMFDNLIKTGSADFSDSLRIGIGGVTEEGQKWLRNPANIPEALRKVKELLESRSFKSTLAKTEAAIVALHGKDWRKTHIFHINCEGGEDTDVYRADVVGYLINKKNPEDRKTILGMSVKDGKSSQMGQIGPLKAAKEIAVGKFDGPELQKVLDKFNPKMQESIKKKIIAGYKKKESFVDNFNVMLMDSFIEGNSSEEKAAGLYEYIRWSMVGTAPPEDEVFVIVDDTHASVVPKSKAPDAIRLKKMFAKAFKEGMFKLNHSKSGLSYDLSLGGKNLTGIRKKRNDRQEVQRILTDKLSLLISMFHDDDPAGAFEKFLNELEKNESTIELRQLLELIIHGDKNVVYS